MRAEDPITHKVWRGKAVQYVGEPAILMQVEDELVMVPAAWCLIEKGDASLEQVGGIRLQTLWEDTKNPGRIVRVIGFDRAWVWRYRDGARTRVQSNSEYEVQFNVVLTGGGKKPRGRQGTMTWVLPVAEFIKKFKIPEDDRG